MEEMIIQERSGFLNRVANIFTRTEEYEEEVETTSQRSTPALHLKSAYKYRVTVRRQIATFEDAMAAAEGLKDGEQQILNLSSTEPVTRQKIVDFMCGVNFAQEGTWEEIGENIYLIAPGSALVELAPGNARSSAYRN